MFQANIHRVLVPNRLLLVLVDSCLIILALILAAAMHNVPPEILWPYVTDANTLSRFLLFVLTCQAGLYYYDLYDFEIVSRRQGLLIRHLQALGAACLLLALFYVWQPEFSLGMVTTLIAVPTIFLIIFGWRWALGRAQILRRNTERVLVLGTGAVGQDLVRQILSRPGLNLKVIGFLDEKGENIGKPLVNPGIIGGVLDLEAIVRREKVHRVIVSLVERRGRMPVEQLLRLKLAGVKVEEVHSLYERLTGRIRLEDISPSWLILSAGFRNGGLGLALKRVLDLLLSILLLVASAPIMAAVALAIWVEDGRPIFFRQARVGLQGKIFPMLKFRSMYQGSEASGPRWTADGDRRITRVGSVIRKYRLDELSQLWNVVRGDMSLVGPRPEQPFFCDAVGQASSYFIQRHSVRPGITGWAQINYRYGASIEEAKTKLEYDFFYLKHMSLWLDLGIMFSTAKVLLSGRGAK